MPEQEMLSLEQRMGEVDFTQARGAVISDDEQYRYLLWRTWDVDLPAVVWDMLNPSTADALLDDPTIRRCIGFSRDEWGYGGIRVVNRFAYRAAKPAVLLDVDDPHGPENAAWVAFACSTAAFVVAAWGACPLVESALPLPDVQLHCLGTTAKGAPRHPLYVKGGTPAILWGGPHA